MNRVRMGYVGCGFMAQKVHIPNICALDECELVAVAEMRADVGKKVQERFRFPKLCRDHKELAADKSIAAVAVSAHYAAQGEIAIELLAAGKDVLMEKPMAISVEQGERILDAERKSGKRLMVAYMKRYDAGNLLVKKLVDQFRKSGELGAIRFVRNHGYCGDWVGGLDTPFEKSQEPYPPASSQWPSWMPEKFQKPYLGYLQQYTHNVNLVRFFLDGGEAKVKAVDLNADDGCRGVVLMEVGGVRTSLETGGIAYHSWEEHTQVYFDKGWIRTEAPPLLLRNTPATVELYRGDAPEKARTQLFPANGYTWSYKEEMRHFAECVATGKPFRSPASDAMDDVRTLEAIYRGYVGQQA